MTSACYGALEIVGVIIIIIIIIIGNGHLWNEWSRDRWRHVTLKGQGRDPNMFGAHYLENGWR